MNDERLLAAEVALRPAATVMLLRDGQDGLEVFMLQRSHNSAFARSQYVFPGGRVDAADAAAMYEPICDGVTDETASARLGLDGGGLAWLVAAIRECFEEAGVLLARRTGSDDMVDTDAPAVVERFRAARQQVYDGSMSLVELCAEQDLQLLTDRMFFVDHWITPVGESRRFDTRFFVAAAPTEQTPLHDSGETIASLWITPTAALEQAANGELAMFPPTVASLRWLQPFSSVTAVIEAASQMPIPSAIEPKLVLGANGEVVNIAMPGDSEYDDATPPVYVVNLAGAPKGPNRPAQG